MYTHSANAFRRAGLFVFLTFFACLGCGQGDPVKKKSMREISESDLRRFCVNTEAVRERLDSGNNILRLTNTVVTEAYNQIQRSVGHQSNAADGFWLILIDWDAKDRMYVGTIRTKPPVEPAPGRYRIGEMKIDPHSYEVVSFYR